MKIKCLLLVSLFSSTLFANGIVFEIHWRASEDSSASARQDRDTEDFVFLNSNPIHFHVVPGSVVSMVSRQGAVRSISRGIGSRLFLNVGNNVVSYTYVTRGAEFMSSGFLESVLYQTVAGRVQKICETLAVAGQRARGSCQSQFHMTLEELDPQLAAQIRELAALLESLQKYSKVDEFKEKFKLAQALLEKMANLEFSELAPEDFEAFGQAKEAILNLRKDIAVLQQEIRETQSRIKENLEKKSSLIKNELSREGIPSLSRPKMEITFASSESGSSTGGEGDTFDKENNIYKTYANKVLDELQANLRSNDRLAFISNVEAWTKTVATYERIALDRQHFSKREWEAFQEHYEAVATFVESHLDKDLWFKDSPIPVEIRESLRAEMRELAESESSDLESALKKLSTKNLTPEQKTSIELVAALVLVAKELSKAPKREEVLPDFRDTVIEATKVIASGISCLAKAQLTSRLGSFYELVSGKSICDGSELSTTERVLSGVELALGTPKLLTFLGTVVGVGTFAKKAEKVMASASDAFKKVGNMAEFFETAFGKLLKSKSAKTSRMIQGQSVYRIESSVQASAEVALRKGDQFYLDGLHKDHLEVFSAKGKFIAVLNLDGSFNLKKFERAAKEGRRI